MAIQVIRRVAALLDAIAGHGEAPNLKTLSAETGLHPSTAFRILSSLAEIGFIERDEGGHYVLGTKLRHLGYRVHMDLDLHSQAKPIMEWLRSEVGETVNLTVREGDEVVYVERATTRRMMRVEQIIGSRAPLHVTAVGKLLLGEHGEQEIRDYAKRTGLPAYTLHTVTEIEPLVHEIQKSVIRGYALDDEEAEPGVGCIGVIVRDGAGNPVAGLSISSPIERRNDAWIPLIVEAGRRVSERIGYVQHEPLAAAQRGS